MKKSRKEKKKYKKKNESVHKCRLIDTFLVCARASYTNACCAYNRRKQAFVKIRIRRPTDIAQF